MCCALLRRLHSGLDKCKCGTHKHGGVDSVAQGLTGQSIANALVTDRYTDTDQRNEGLTVKGAERCSGSLNGMEFTGIPAASASDFMQIHFLDQ